MFQVVFSIGPAAERWVSANLLKPAVELVGRCCRRAGCESLLIDGVWNGVASVLVFLPQILLLFLFIGVLEDSGYLARAALIADRVMRSIGLNGKAFIPLLSAYACAVPAIMATRTIENKRDRLATILVAPFMTCSARLPIYMLMIAAFIPNKPMLGDFFGLRAAVMLWLYVLGFVAALATAWLLKSSILKASSAPFILELPQYRLPTSAFAGAAADGSRQGFREAGGHGDSGGDDCALAAEPYSVSHGGHPDLAESLIGRLGHVHRAGDSPAGIQLEDRDRAADSVMAREVIVGTLGTLYGADPATQSYGTAGGTAA